MLNRKRKRERERAAGCFVNCNTVIMAVVSEPVTGLYRCTQRLIDRVEERVNVSQWGCSARELLPQSSAGRLTAAGAVRGRQREATRGMQRELMLLLCTLHCQVVEVVFRSFA